MEIEMTFKFKLRPMFAIVLAGLATACWSPASYACSAEPLVASVCTMAFNPGQRFQSMNQYYMLAAGQQLTLNQYAALYSLIGITYGGDGRTNFNLPDLRGKVIVGYDPRDTTRAVGATGGSATIKLTVAQLPQHAMTITNMPVNLATGTVTTTLSGLTGTANLSGVVLTGPATGLTIKASSANGQATAGGNFIGKSNGNAGNIYSSAPTPDSTLNAGSIAGNLSLTVNAGTTAPVSIGGTAASTLTGSATASGTSNSIGAGADVPVMPPYVVMPYYIAYNGIYPSGN
jgi:microcystin-dependent protein